MTPAPKTPSGQNFQDVQRQRDRYRNAHLRATRAAEASGFFAQMRVYGRNVAALQAALVVMGVIVNHVVSISGLVGAGCGAAMSMLAEGRIAKKFRAMRVAIRKMGADPSDRLVYGLHRASMLVSWLDNSNAQFPFGRRFAQWRATRAVHQVTDRAIAALGAPETDATARAVLGSAGALIKQLFDDNLLDLRALRRHCNKAFVIAREHSDRAITDSLYREVAMSGDLMFAKLRKELAEPREYLPIRTRFALAMASTREWKRAQEAESHWLFELGEPRPTRRTRNELRSDLPAWLRGDRRFLRTVLREARRAQILAEAERVILVELRVSSEAIAEVRPPTEIPVELGAVVREAEMRAMRFRLGDPRVKRHELIDDARRVAFRANIMGNVPRSVLTENNERIEALGLSEAVHAKRPADYAARDVQQGTRVSEAHIANLFAAVRSPQPGGRQMSSPEL